MRPGTDTRTPTWAAAPTLAPVPGTAPGDALYEVPEGPVLSEFAEYRIFLHSGLSCQWGRPDLKLPIIVDTWGSHHEEIHKSKTPPLDREARRRLAVIRHVEEVTGSVAMSCRYFGISRQAYVTGYCRYQAEGIEGLRPGRLRRRHHRQ